MSFQSWLQNLRSALAPSRGKRPNRRPGSPRATLYRPTFEVLEDRLTFSLSSASEFLVGADPQAVVTGEFNNDGKLDLATANYGDGTVSVLLGDGLGKFGAPQQSAVGTRLASVWFDQVDSYPRLLLAMWTLTPTIRLNVKQLLTNGFPNSLFDAASWSRCRGCGL